mgnify:CR=1 FL=1
MFVNRVKELQLLNDEYKEEGFDFQYFMEEEELVKQHF